MFKKLLSYIVLPSEITRFERSYLARINRIALVFFLLHVPFLTLVAALNHTGPLLALALTLVAVAGPVLARRVLTNPRHVSIVFGITAMLMGGILVHFGRGLWTIEMHFYFFVALALLAVFANPMVIVVAAGTVAVHHLALWAVSPESVFNYDAPVTSVLLHAGFVVVESVAACFVARSFFDNVVGLERIVAERTQALDRKNRDMQVVFDNVKQGFLTADVRGQLSNEHSRAVAEWIGAPRSGEMLWDFFGRAAPAFGEWLRITWEMVVDDVMPLELSLEQLPKRLVCGERTLEIAYQPVRNGDALESFLIVVTDASERIARERADAQQRETVAAFERIVRDRAGFVDFFEETTGRIAALSAEPCELGQVELRREIHTVKGNCALFGISSVAEICNAVETRCGEPGEEVTAEDRRRVASAWTAARERLGIFIGADRASTIELSEEEYRKLLAIVEQLRVPSDVKTLLASLRHEPTRNRLARFAEQARALAARLGKGDVAIGIDDNAMRLPSESLAPFWASMVHVVRNAVDHGLAVGEDRPAPWLGFGTRVEDDRVVVAVEDNGRGVDWDAVRRAARSRSLPAESRADLENALFSDGLTTRDAATDVSGRGVGLAAVAEACRALDGDIRVLPRKGGGTRFEFRLPLERVIPTPAAA